MDTILISAKEAKRIAEERQEIYRVMDLIWTETLHGNKSAYCEELSDDTIKQLEDLGYEVEERGLIRDTPSYYISWK